MLVKVTVRKSHFAASSLLISGMLILGLTATLRTSSLPAYAAGFDSDIEVANRMLHAGRVDEARELLVEISRKEPLRADARVALGICYRKSGEVMHAIDALTAAIKLDPDSYDAHLQLGLVLRNMKLEREAAIHFRRCKQIDPARQLSAD